MCVLGSHEKYAQDFADTCQTAGIDLTYINGFGLQELLEDHAIVGMLAGGNADAMRLQCLANCSVAEDVVWCGWFLDEPTVDMNTFSCKEQQAYLPRLDGLEFLHVLDCLRDVPYLVSIYHEHGARWTRVLPLERRTIRITAFGAGREVPWVVDDRADDQSTAEIIFDICSEDAANSVELEVDCCTSSRMRSMALTTACAPEACSSTAELISWVISFSRVVARAICEEPCDCSLVAAPISCANL